MSQTTSSRLRKILLCFSIFYLLSYTGLSLGGTYVPAAWGAGWVKWYRWAPAGFVSGPAGTEYSNTNRILNLFYYPLLVADNKLIHTRDKAKTGDWPINSLLDEALRDSYGEYYRDLEKKNPGSRPRKNEPRTRPGNSAPKKNEKTSSSFPLPC